MNYIIYSPTLLFVLLILLIVFYKYKYIRLLIILLSIFLLYFFRGYNKNELIKYQNNYILSPADGTIKNIYIYKNYIRICIYLNIFNKHVQIIPYDGKILKLKYKKGEFNIAHILKKSNLNERMEITILSSFGKYKVIQYAGLIARRILTFLNVNEYKQKGDVLGLIKFSSRVDILLPKHMHILVNINQKINLGQPIAINKIINY